MFAARYALVLVSAILVSCGDDDEEHDAGMLSARDAATGGSGGSPDASSHGGMGGGGSQSLPEPKPFMCKPDDLAPGSCDRCVAEKCCEECGEVNACNGEFLECVQSCFGADDAGASIDPLERLVACGDVCFVEFDYVRRDLLACVTGTARPTPADSDDAGRNFSEGLEDDAGPLDACRAECFPGWE